MTIFRRERKGLDVTQLELSQLSGIHALKISILERGLVEPRPDEKERLLAALKLCKERREEKVKK